jgi:hypothetical protein
VDKLAELIQTIIKQIPWLLWPLLIVLFIWGMFLILRQLYSFGHQVRRNYITELKEHLDFREAVINDISVQNAQLETQCYELRMETAKKQEIVDKTIESAIAIVTEKDMELQRLKNDTDVIIQHLKYALGTALWVSEREMSIRQILLALLSKSEVPSDIDKLLRQYIGAIVSIIKSDESICYEEKNPPTAADFFESRAFALSPYYLHLPITEEISLFANIRDEILKMPSFIDAKAQTPASG